MSRQFNKPPKLEADQATRAGDENPRPGDISVGESTALAKSLDAERQVARDAVRSDLITQAIVGTFFAAAVVLVNSATRNLTRPAFTIDWDFGDTSASSLFGVLLSLLAVNLTINLTQAAWTGREKGMVDGATIVWSRTLEFVSRGASMAAIGFAIIAVIIGWRSEASAIIGCILVACMSAGLGSICSLNRPISLLAQASSFSAIETKLSWTQQCIDQTQARSVGPSRFYAAATASTVITMVPCSIVLVVTWSVRTWPSLDELLIAIGLLVFLTACTSIFFLVLERDRLVLNGTIPNRCTRASIKSVAVVVGSWLIFWLAASQRGGPPLFLFYMALFTTPWLTAMLSANLVAPFRRASPARWLATTSLRAMQTRECALRSQRALASRAIRQLLDQRRADG